MNTVLSGADANSATARNASVLSRSESKPETEENPFRFTFTTIGRDEICHHTFNLTEETFMRVAFAASAFNMDVQVWLQHYAKRTMPGQPRPFDKECESAVLYVSEPSWQRILVAEAAADGKTRNEQVIEMVRSSIQAALDDFIFDPNTGDVVFDSGGMEWSKQHVRRYEPLTAPAK